jgi:hypothetical protein
MVVVVADPILEASRRPGGLNTPDEPFGEQDAKGVVYRLERNGADVASDGFGYAVGRDVGLPAHRPQDSQSLGRDLNAALAKEVRRVRGHEHIIAKSLELFKN